MNRHHAILTAISNPVTDTSPFVTFTYYIAGSGSGDNVNDDLSGSMQSAVYISGGSANDSSTAITQEADFAYCTVVNGIYTAGSAFIGGNRDLASVTVTQTFNGSQSVVSQTAYRYSSSAASAVSQLSYVFNSSAIERMKNLPQPLDVLSPDVSDSQVAFYATVSFGGLGGDVGVSVTTQGAGASSSTSLFGTGNRIGGQGGRRIGGHLVS